MSRVLFLQLSQLSAVIIIIKGPLPVGFILISEVKLLTLREEVIPNEAVTPETLSEKHLLFRVWIDAELVAFMYSRFHCQLYLQFILAELGKKLKLL